MKIKSLYIDKFKGLRDFLIEFNDNVTILIGENGTGKTTILETIYDMLMYHTDIVKNKVMDTPHNIVRLNPFLIQDSEFKGCKMELDLKQENSWLFESFRQIMPEFDYSNSPLSLKLVRNTKNGVAYDGNWSILNYIASLSILETQRKDTPHIVYLPTEINFKKYKVESVKKVEKYVEFGLILNSETIGTELKDFLVYQHYRDLEDRDIGKEGNRIKKYKDLYNSFFEDKEFIGIHDLEPLFKIKSTGETHSVDQLSSGEKQIFFRAGSILEYDLENSIILLKTVFIIIKRFIILN